MSTFDDFDLDIARVNNGSSDGTRNITSGFWCSYITGKFVDSLFQSCATCALNPLSCDCSASDMTACTVCEGKGHTRC